jgi:hypothetical protein
MNEPLDEQYLKWLYSQVASVRLKNPARTYWSLLRQLYSKEYVWLVANDDNRVEDGRDLRKEFKREIEIGQDNSWMELGCSMLEMLIALSRRLNFESEHEDGPAHWFWHMLNNVGLEQYSDMYYTNTFTKELVEDILDTVIQRNFDPDGMGGLFPLDDPPEDQRFVELWYQSSSYLLEIINYDD